MDSTQIYFLLKFQGEVISRFDMNADQIEVTIGRKWFSGGY